MMDTAGWLGLMAIITFGSLEMAGFVAWLHHRDVDPGPRADA